MGSDRQTRCLIELLWTANKHSCSLRIWNWNEAKHVAYPAKGCQLPIIDSLLFVRFPGTVLLIDILFSDAPSVLMNSVFEEKKEKNIYFILESPCHQHNHHHHHHQQQWYESYIGIQILIDIPVVDASAAHRGPFIGLGGRRGEVFSTPTLFIDCLNGYDHYICQNIQWRPQHRHDHSDQLWWEQDQPPSPGTSPHQLLPPPPSFFLQVQIILIIHKQNNQRRK